LQLRMTYTIIRVGILCQERFQSALRERLNFKGVCNTRIRDRCQAMHISTNTDTYYFNDKWSKRIMIASPCVGYPSSFHVLDVLEHKLDRIDGWLTRHEDHWNASGHRRGREEKNIIFYAPQGVLVWQLTT
jgi:AcrR family transcriptional regulator